MFTKEELQEIFRRLAEPFPEDAVERTSGAVTHKGYDTTGYKYIHVVNRLNEVLGVGGFKVEHEFSVREKPSKNGGILFDVTCDMVVQLGHWVDGKFVTFAEASGTGGHLAAGEADAKKGSYTNGFKKTVAMFGCGWQSYAGAIDDDNVAADHDDDERWAHRPAAPARVRALPNSKPATAEPPPTSNSQVDDRERTTGRGRITSAQIGKLRELVAETGGEWNDFRSHVRNTRGVNLEYANKEVASSLITELVAAARQRRNGANGSAPEGRAR